MAQTNLELTTMASGVGGSYTKWQMKPPEHKVIMAKHTDNDQWTTVKVYNLTDKPSFDDNLRIESGAMGPNDTPFAHDVDYEDLSEEAQNKIQEYAIQEFTQGDSDDT